MQPYHSSSGTSHHNPMRKSDDGSSRSISHDFGHPKFIQHLLLLHILNHVLVAQVEAVGGDPDVLRHGGAHQRALVLRSRRLATHFRHFLLHPAGPSRPQLHLLR